MRPFAIPAIIGRSGIRQQELTSEQQVAANTVVLQYGPAKLASLWNDGSLMLYIGGAVFSISRDGLVF